MARPMTTTPGAPDTQGARPPGNPTPRFLFPTEAKRGDLEDEIFSVLCTAGRPTSLKGRLTT
jgi:hypothetical protein